MLPHPFLTDVNMAYGIIRKSQCGRRIPVFICCLLGIWALAQIGVKEAMYSRWASCCSFSWEALKCFPSQMICNNPCVLPWGHVTVGCALNRSTWSHFDRLLFGILVPTWCDLDKIFPIIPFSRFIYSDLRLCFWDHQHSFLSSVRVHSAIAFLSIWLKEPWQCDVPVCARYLSKDKGNCVLFQAASRHHSTNSNSLLNAARLNRCRS